MRRGSDRIDEERVCIDSLVQYLKRLDVNSSIEAQEEPDDPPDYWLTVAEHQFAVEITSIVVDQCHDDHCKTLHDSIKEQYESDSTISGTYAVKFFRRPDIPRRGSREWKNLVADAVVKLSTLTGSAPGSERCLLDNSNGSVTISKLSTEGKTVGIVQTPEPKSEWEAQRELSLLLEQAIGTKLEKLKKNDVMIRCKDVILILYDAYPYARISTAMRAFSSIKGYGWLHSIFWAASFSGQANAMYPESPGRVGRFLYSKNEAWQPRA